MEGRDRGDSRGQLDEKNRKQIMLENIGEATDLQRVERLMMMMLQFFFHIFCSTNNLDQGYFMHLLLERLN